MTFTPPPQQFCVRWNSYQSNLQNAFPKLLTSEHFVDVTLACENEMLKCHKVVLSACSTYFEKLLVQNPCQHPIIFMKDMKFHEVQSLVDFMYKGEVNVTQDDLPSLLRSAEALQIRGLCGTDQLLSQNFVKTQLAKANAAVAAASHANSNTTNNSVNDTHISNSSKVSERSIKCEKTEEVENAANQSSSETDSNDGLQIREDTEIVKEEIEESFYEGETEMLDTEFIEGDGTVNTGLDDSTQVAIANVSCHYDVNQDFAGGSVTKRIRRTDEELRRAAECITRGQTFQNVSDQFGIPISTIRFYMARKGILPVRKRGRSCSLRLNMPPSGVSNNSNSYSGAASNFNNSTSGNTSPIGPPYHIVHYKLPQLGVSKLK